MYSLSVVIPTYNRRQQLQQVLQGLCQQTLPASQFEVIVVADGCQDDTAEFLHAYHPPYALTPLIQANQGVARARNDGWRAAKSDLILFIDDDVVPTPTLLAQHLAHHHTPQTIVLGPMLSPPQHQLPPWVDWEQMMLMKQYNDMVQGKWAPTARQFYTGNTSIGRHWLERSGGFDPHFHRAEDVELAYRLADLGAQFHFNPQAIGYHYANRSFNSWLAIPYAYGKNDVIFNTQKGQTWLLPTMWKEYHGRHILIRALTYLTLDRPPFGRIALKILKTTAEIGNRLKFSLLARIAYSGIFNLRYYQGVADQLGGRNYFFDGVARAQS